MTDRELMQQALDALEKIAAYRPLTFAECSDAEAVMGIAEKAIPALRERLAQPEQEPVAHTTGHCENHKQKGGCQLHNLQCGWPDCDRKPITTPRQMQPCAGRNCGSTNPNLHSAECFEDYEKSTGMAQPEQEPVACQYAKDVAMPEYRCAGKCQYAQPEQEPVAWEDVLGAIARGWTHDDNKHKPMDVQLAVAIAKEIQDMTVAPPKRKPLTDDRVWLEYMQLWPFRPNDEPTLAKDILRFARAIEAAHGIKGS